MDARLRSETEQRLAALLAESLKGRDDYDLATIERLDSALLEMAPAAVAAPVIPPVQGDDESNKVAFFRMLTSMSDAEVLKADNTELARIWKNRGGRGRLDPLRRLAGQYKQGIKPKQ
jgi:hypothetical protein